jgi:hypothetical protein
VQEQVALHTYLAAGTIDNYSVNLVQRKASWIDQLLRTKSDVFTNPNSENSVDADELLLALTEEWGDKDAVQKSRGEMARIKEERITGAQAKQMKANLKNLSLARGSLANLAGREHTAEYKKRGEQIHNLEESLKHNPVFTKHDLLETGEPFLYNAHANMIFRKGDIFMNSDGIFTVEKFKYKKQELVCRRLMPDSERLRQEAARHGRAFSGLQTFSVVDLGGTGRWKHDKAAVICEKADPETTGAVRAAAGTEFYGLPERLKARHYELHVTICSQQYGSPSPPLFLETRDGTLKLDAAAWNPENGEHALLNPFSDEGRQKINAAAARGVECHDYRKAAVMESLETVSPALKTAIVTIMEKQENAKRGAETRKLENKTSVAGVETAGPALARPGRGR